MKKKRKHHHFKAFQKVSLTERKLANSECYLIKKKKKEKIIDGKNWKIQIQIISFYNYNLNHESVILLLGFWYLKKI